MTQSRTRFWPRTLKTNYQDTSILRGSIWVNLSSKFLWWKHETMTNKTISYTEIPIILYSKSYVCRSELPRRRGKILLTQADCFCDEHLVFICHILNFWPRMTFNEFAKNFFCKTWRHFLCRSTKNLCDHSFPRFESRF